MATRDVVPAFWVIGNEVTEFVSSELERRVGRTVYMGLWDETEVTYLRSLTPSGYVYYWTGGFFTEKELSEADYDTLREMPENEYHDYQELVRLKGKVLCPYNPTQAEWEEMVDDVYWGDVAAAYEDLVEHILDQLSGNTMECEVAAAMGFKFDFEQEQVTLISSGYDWTCPGCNKDGHVNTQETKVQCFHCSKVFKVGDVVHPEVR